MRATDEKLGIEVGLELQDGQYRQLRQIVFIENESGKAHHLPIRDGTTSDQLQAAYKALNVKSPFETRVFYDLQEEPWVRDLIHAAWPSAIAGPSAVSATNYRGLTVNFELTERYFRAIAKIGFHYFLTQFPQYDGAEPIFFDLRQYVFDGGGTIDRANQFIGVRQAPLIVEMLDPRARPDGWHAHLLCAEIQRGAHLAHLQTFLSEDWPGPIYTIKLGADPGANVHRGRGHGYVYFPNGPQGKFSGEVHDLIVVQTDAPLPQLRPVIN
jgi:hypothetical protein